MTRSSSISLMRWLALFAALPLALTSTVSSAQTRMMVLSGEITSPLHCSIGGKVGGQRASEAISFHREDGVPRGNEGGLVKRRRYLRA